MLNPSVGEIVSMESPVRRRRIVVLPALSRPRMRMRISFSFSFTCIFVVVDSLVNIFLIDV